MSHQTTNSVKSLLRVFVAKHPGLLLCVAKTHISCPEVLDMYAACRNSGDSDLDTACKSQRVNLLACLDRDGITNPKPTVAS